MMGSRPLAGRLLAVVGAVAIVGGLACGSAWAGALSSDPNAYNDGTQIWRGTATLTSGGGLSGSVDWVVYAPGYFPGTAYTYGSPWSPPHSEPAGNEFVYAYQLTVAGSIGVSNFAVQMLEGNKAHAIGHDTSIGLSGGAAEDDAYFTWGGHTEWSNLANWDFYGDGLLQDNSSAVMLFSTINAPLMLQGRILDGGTYAYGDLASPSNLEPEPATLGLLATGLVLVLRRRRRANAV